MEQNLSDNWLGQHPTGPRFSFSSEAPANVSLRLDFVLNPPDESVTDTAMPTVSASSAKNRCGDILIKLQPDEHGTFARVRYKE